MFRDIVPLLPRQGDDEGALTTVPTVFEEVYSLPGTEIESSIGHRDCEAGADEDIFQVGGHVVRAFECVIKLSPTIGNEMAEEMFGIAADIGIIVFVQCQRSRAVLEKEVRNSGLNTVDVGDDLIGDQMNPSYQG